MTLPHGNPPLDFQQSLNLSFIVEMLQARPDLIDLVDGWLQYREASPMLLLIEHTLLQKPALIADALILLVSHTAQEANAVVPHVASITPPYGSKNWADEVNLLDDDMPF